METSFRAPRRVRGLLLFATAALVWGVGAPTDARAVSSAAEICAPTADPCIIDTSVSVDHESTLDFGTRTVLITGGGELDIGAGTVDILCGRLEASGLTGTDPIAILARGPSLQGAGRDGGTLDVRAQRSCTEDIDRGCTSDVACDLGQCDTFVCTQAPTRTCLSDAGCDVGPCVANPNTGTSRCAGSSARCDDDADCVLGTCDFGNSVCSRAVDQSCSVDADCDAGQCLIGHGDVDLDGRIRADGQVPGSITFVSVGDIRLRQDIILNANDREEDGGFLQLDAQLGDIVIDGKIDAIGGNDGQGGDLTFSAGRDLIVNGIINVDGGAFDGGFIDIFVGRDVTMRGNVQASSVLGDGFGGEISLLAGRDINLPGPSEWTTNGSEDEEAFCGEAGPQELDADRNVNIGPAALLQADGPRPDCGGEEINISAGNDAFIAGQIDTRGRGTDSNGGLIEISAGGVASFASTADLDATGGSLGGGSIEISANVHLFFDGRADAAASSAGSADTIALQSECRLEVGGDLLMAGTAAGSSNGTIDVDGGTVIIKNGAQITNGGEFSENFFRASDFIVVQTGAVVSADTSSGVNTMTYRDAATPPVIDGTVSPAPDLVPNAAIPASPCICGNGVVENGETCDDGNLADGDGCSSGCQSEGCLVATPGYPAVPLCDDDNECTVDTCDGQTGQCVNTIDCDDGIACTTDSCGAGVCQHSPVDALCNDGNICTENICATSSGCIVTFTTNACNDGIDCTEDEVCERGECVGTPMCPAGSLCDLDLGMCVETVACGNGAIEPPEQCDDGDSIWENGQGCNASCGTVQCGDPDDNGSTTASDALFVLRTAVSLEVCDLCVCNVDSIGTSVTAGDALRTLQAAVGVPTTLVCPACS